MITVIMDLESTCWEKRTDPKEQEIIEIGAVKLDTSFETVDEFDRFVRPKENPALSKFCQELTHISQKDIDKAGTFDVVFPAFLNWIGESAYSIASWGDFDIKHIKIDCKRHAVSFPKRFEKKHLNVKALFAQKRRIRPCGMTQALQMMNIPLEGTHHRGIDDARNIVKIFRTLM
jgi:inhibitor of KinA sporulation pathway (predicted exonuclease)